MNEQTNKFIITKDALMKDVLDALNAGITIDEMVKSSGIKKIDLERKIKYAGIEKNELGIYIAITNKSLAKVLGGRIDDIRNSGHKKEGKKEQILQNNLEQFNAEIRQFRISNREKAKQYTPSRDVWQKVKILKEYFFDVQQDWLIDALINAGVNSLQLSSDVKKQLDDIG